MRKTLIALSMAHFSVMALSMPRFGGIALEYGSEDDVPENHKDLYTERDGKWVLTGVEGGSYDNIRRLESSLEKERKDHKDTKGKYGKLNGKNIDELLERDSQFDELKIRAENNKFDDTKIEEMVSIRLKQKLAPIERERDEWKNKATTFESQVGELTGKEKTRTIRDTIRKAASTHKVLDTAIEDIEVLGERLFEIDDSGRVVAKENVGITPGIDPAMWLGDQRDKKPHWFPGNVGGGGGGSKGNPGGGVNPWSHDGWNLTEQGKILRENKEKAIRMASMHGVDINNPRRPAKK